MAMDVRQLEYFITIFEYGSFTRAAQKLHVVQPALSMQIRRLEEELGVSLFKRVPRGLQPTAFGKMVYGLCSPVLGELARTKQNILDAIQSVDLSGSIRAGFPTPLFKTVVSRAVALFAEQYPNVELQIFDSYSGTLAEWVRTGKIDFALGAWSEKDKEIVRDMTMEDEVVLVSGRPLGKPYAPVDLGRIAGLKLLIPTVDSTTGPLVNGFIASGAIKPERTLVINSHVGVNEVARVSDWCGITPASGITDAEYASKELHFHPVLKPRFHFAWNLIHGRRNPLNSAARRFIDFIAAEFGGAHRKWQSVNNPTRANRSGRTGGGH
jgi:DNA-binding transcriptional LysR family regulator